MFNKRLFTAVMAVGILLGSLTPTMANAAVTVFNSLTGKPSYGTAPFSFSNSISASFSVGASLNFGLTSVVLSLSGDNTTHGTLTMYLYGDLYNATDNTSRPNFAAPIAAVFNTVSDDMLDITLHDYEFSAVTPVHLVSGGRYWINVVATGDSSAQWSFAETDSGFGVATEYFTYLNPSPGDVNEYCTPDLCTYPNSFGPQQMKVSGIEISVPEPGTLALVGLGLFSLGLRGLRKGLS